MVIVTIFMPSSNMFTGHPQSISKTLIVLFEVPLLKTAFCPEKAPLAVSDYLRRAPATRIAPMFCHTPSSSGPILAICLGVQWKYCPSSLYLSNFLH